MGLLGLRSFISFRKMDLNARSIGFSSSCPHAIPRDQLGELAHNIDQKAPSAQRTLLHIGNGIPLGATKERLFHVGQITQLSGGDGKSMRKRKGGPSREEFRPLNQSSPKPQYTMSTIDGLVAINAMYQSAFGNLLQHFSPLLASQTASDESIHQMKRMASNLNEAGVSSLDETNDNQRDRQGLHSSDSPDHFSPFSVDDVDTMSGSSSVALKRSSSSSFHSSDPKIHQQLTPSDCGRHSSSSIHLNSAGQGEQLTPSSQDETRESSSFIYPSSIRQGEQVLQSPQNNAIEALKDRVMELERQADSQNKKLEEKEAQFKAANESNVKLKKEADSLKKKLEDKEELLLAANSENIRLQEEVRAAREGSRMVDDMEDAQDEDQSTRSSGIAVEEEGILDAPEFVRQFSFPVTIICYYDIVDSLNAQQAALNETFHADNEDDQVPNNDNEREKVSQNSSGNEDDSSNSTGDKGQTDVSERKTIENSQQTWSSVVHKFSEDGSQCAFHRVFVFLPPCHSSRSIGRIGSQYRSDPKAPSAQRTLLHIGNGIPLGATKERLFHVGQITQLSGGDGKSMRKRKGGPSREEFRPLNQSSPKPQYTMSTIDGLVAINAMYQSAFGNLLQHFSPLLASQTASDESIHQMKRMASNLNEAGVSSLDETNDNQRDRQGLHSSDSPDHFSPFSVDDVDTMSGSSSVALKRSSSSSFHSSDPKIHQQLTPSDCGRHSSSSIHLNSAGQGEQLTPSSQDETRESSSFIYPSSIRQGEQVLQSPQNNAIEALKDRVMELERQADSQNKKLEEKEAQFKAANESNVKLKKEADSLKKKLEDKEELLLAANSENIRLQEEVRAAREGSRMVDDMEDAQDEDQSTRSSGIAVEEEGILDAPEFVRQFSFPVTIICYYDIVDSLNAQQAALNETFHADNEDDQVPNNDNEREKVSQNSSGNEDDSSNSTGDKGQTDVSERKTIENSQQTWSSVVHKFSEDGSQCAFHRVFVFLPPCHSSRSIGRIGSQYRSDPKAPSAQRTLLHIGNGIPLGATKERLFHVGQITQLSGGDGKSMRKRKGGPSREEFRPLNQSSPKPQYTMSTIDGLVAINAMYQSAFGNLLQHFSPLLASQTASDESIHQMKRMASNLNEAGVSSLDETNDNQRDRQGLHSSDSPDHFSPFSVDDVDTMSGSSSVALKRSSSSSFHSSDPKIHQQLTPSDCGRHSSSSIHLNSAGQGEQLTPSSQDETRESSSFIYPSSIRQGEQVLQSPQNNAIEALKDRVMELERQADSQNKKLEEKEAQFKAANESNVKLKKEADSLKKKLEDKEELLLAANSENIRLQEEVRAAREGSRMVDDMEDAQDEDQSTRSSGIAVEEEGILDAPEFVRQFSFPVTIICYYDIVDSLNAQQAALNETFHADNEDDQVPNNDNEREKVSQNSSGNEDDSSNSTGDKGQTDVSERKTIENSQQLKRSGRLAQKNRAENGNVYEEETDNANSHQTNGTMNAICAMQSTSGQPIGGSICGLYTEIPRNLNAKHVEWHSTSTEMPYTIGRKFIPTNARNAIGASREKAISVTGICPDTPSAEDPVADVEIDGNKPIYKNNRMFAGEEFAFADWPWAVFIGADVPEINQILVYCEGSFISRRHIITARHCLISEVASEKWKRIVIYGGTKWSTAPETFKRVGIRKKIYPVNRDHHDIGIAELEHDFEGSAMGVACLPKQSDYANDDNFEKIGRFIGGGIGGNGQETGDRLKILTYNLTDPDVVLYTPRQAAYAQLFFMSFRTVQSREAHGYAARGDSGGPLLRKRLTDDKFVLFGVLKGSNSSEHCSKNNCHDGWDMFTTAKYFVITGICPDQPTPEDTVADIEIDGSRVCK
ncbi:hypothetical protein PRIPAC_73468 [Pristionchus pacificus]|uniref:Trypsin n=1 Tax=Pristionchus pacificus TaxID=54126 RepID=A0A2A6C5C7_PRIPA|nr:hypothetical protein PRIPAC_73468 [Pristionchus pacificus]|eukprot:PDM73317.1 Trypsin [Pristionchus pacificus]